MRRTEDILMTRVRGALGATFDKSADYVVVRPAMVGTPKYATCVVVGEFAEDGRDGTKLVVLRRPAAKPPPAPSAAERVRAALGRRKP